MMWGVGLHRQHRSWGTEVEEEQASHKTVCLETGPSRGSHLP